MDQINSDKRKDIIIKKASGDEEQFSGEKLKRSLRNAGAENDIIEEIVADITAWIYSGVTTKEIYRRAFKMLRRRTKVTGIRYKLKHAILELGPTGYPFETLIGQLFEHKGYKTEVGIVVDGNCVTHEMDVIATQDKTQQLVECKYHKDQGKSVSVQVPLYVRSRVNDIIQKRKEMPEYAELNFNGWIVTNTSFSSDSIQYGECAGLKLLSWDYPHGKGLKDIIEELKIYPITVLTKITVKEKQILLEQGLVTCPQLLKNPDALNSFAFSNSKTKAVMEELKRICY